MLELGSRSARVMLCFGLLMVACGNDPATQGSGDAAVPDGNDGSVDTDGATVHDAATDPNVRLSALVLSEGTLSPGFAPTTIDYTVSVPDTLGIVPFTVTASTANPAASIAVNGNPVSSGVASSPIVISLTMPTPIDIAVSAPGATTAHTTLVVSVVTEHVYVKASNTRGGAEFGNGLAISGDTLVIGADHESSGSPGIGGNQADTSKAGAGAVYVFVRGAAGWTQQAYLKASTVHAMAEFGSRLALSGNTLAVAAPFDPSAARGVNGDETDTSMQSAGAVYIFVRNGTTWSQQAYIKASNNQPNMVFGGGVALSGDSLAVGAFGETSNATGVGGNEDNATLAYAGAAYVFVRNGTTWTQQAYLKASNTRADATFGYRVALDGNTLAVGANGESSNATGVNGNQADTSAPGAGAVYVFTRNGTTWSQQAYVKASNTRTSAGFGVSVALQADSLVVGSPGESSNATGVNGNQADTTAPISGAAYVFTRAGTTWTQQAYVKASNTRSDAAFGTSVALAGDTLAVGATRDSSKATGVHGDGADTSVSNAGAAYVYNRSGSTWTPRAYVKATNTRVNAYFGSSIALSDTLAVGAFGDTSNATGIGGNEADTSRPLAGAVYLVR